MFIYSIYTTGRLLYTENISVGTFEHRCLPDYLSGSGLGYPTWWTMDEQTVTKNCTGLNWYGYFGPLTGPFNFRPNSGPRTGPVTDRTNYGPTVRSWMLWTSLGRVSTWRLRVSVTKNKVFFLKFWIKIPYLHIICNI